MPGQRGALSQEAAANAIQQANSELNRAAQHSSIRQEALDNLATNLRDTAAGSDIAQSLPQGDYQKAAQQLRDLAQQVDQLSPPAKQQLSQALANSAADVSNVVGQLDPTALPGTVHPGESVVLRPLADAAYATVKKPDGSSSRLSLTAGSVVMPGSPSSSAARNSSA